MKVAIIGASGFVGTPLTREALSRGHQVTAIVRNPEKILVKDPHLSVVKGDVFQADQISALVKGHEAVISAYNAGWGNPNLYTDFLTGSKDIQEATRKAGVKRFLVVGGAGSLEVSPGLQIVDSPTFPDAYKPVALAHRDAFHILRASDLNWTYFSPAMMIQPGERTGKFRLGKDALVSDDKGNSAISAEDYAIALVDEVEQGRHTRQRFTIGY